MNSSDQKIPAEILAILKDNVWQPTEGYSSFDSVWSEKEDNRRRDPSYYWFFKDRDDHINNGISTAEAASLFKLVMFRGIIRDSANALAFNEHAQHALLDFCGEVYDAWRKFQNRLKTIKSVKPIDLYTRS